MKQRLSACLLATLVTLLPAAANSVRADFLDWGYHWNVNTPVISSGTGSVALAVVQDGSGAATIPAVSITTTSAASPINPDVFHANYNLTLTLTDNSSNSSGNLTFAGLINGTLTATGSALTNTFLSPMTQQLTIGQHVYTVTMDPAMTHLLPPGSATPPLLDATVQVANVTPNTGGSGGTGGTGGSGGTAGNTPEPASLVLGGLGFSLLGVGSWWKRTRRTELPAA
jgi:hypothetical protein